MLHRNSKEKFETILEFASHIDRPRRLPVVATINDLRQRITDTKFHGVQWNRFTKLNEYLRGHRPGELTIVTGPTGSGKTTFVSEYSLDLCEQGIQTLWGSFEIHYLDLERKMLTQFMRKSFDYSNQDDLDIALAKFAQLPLSFLDFHGQTNIEEVLDEARHAVLMHGVQHLIIDNLQFMLGNCFFCFLSFTNCCFILPKNFVRTEWFW